MQNDHSTLLDIVVIAQVAASVAMAGLIWTIQLVQYPLLRGVHHDFIDHELEHRRRITPLVGPLMAIEGVCVLALLALRPSQFAWWLPLVGAAAEAIAIGTTAFVSAPLHVRLSDGRDGALIERLIRTNWIRTAAWTARAAISIVMVVSVR